MMAMTPSVNARSLPFSIRSGRLSQAWAIWRHAGDGDRGHAGEDEVAEGEAADGKASDRGEAADTH
jgi:hypothetical protein